MVVPTNITTKVINIINKYYPEAVPEEKTRNKKSDRLSDDSEIALAIAVAYLKKARGEQ